MKVITDVVLREVVVPASRNAINTPKGSVALIIGPLQKGTTRPQKLANFLVIGGDRLDCA